MSILVNAILLGHSNQTFSGRNYEWKKAGKPNLVFLLDLLLGEDHCLEDWINWMLIKDVLDKRGIRK